MNHPIDGRNLMVPGARAQVMLLGTFHFDAPGLDALNTKVDMTTPQRQREIEEVVRLLERFRPTKVAVEAPLDAEGRLQERFQAYRNGSFALPPNEIYQLGFRLAARLGHERLYPIDARDRHYETEEQFLAYARSRGVAEEEQLVDLIHDPHWWDRFRRWHQYLEERIATMTLREYLAFINAPEQVRLSHTIYLAWPDAPPGDYTVVDFRTGWYNRNLRIFANLKRITQPPEDRILVIYGSGHLPILRHCVEHSYQHELVEVGPFLAADPPA